MIWSRVIAPAWPAACGTGGTSAAAARGSGAGSCSAGGSTGTGVCGGGAGGGMVGASAGCLLPLVSSTVGQPRRGGPPAGSTALTGGSGRTTSSLGSGWPGCGGASAAGAGGGAATRPAITSRKAASRRGTRALAAHGVGPGPRPDRTATRDGNRGIGGRGLRPRAGDSFPAAGGPFAARLIGPRGRVYQLPTVGFSRGCKRVARGRWQRPLSVRSTVSQAPGLRHVSRERRTVAGCGNRAGRRSHGQPVNWLSWGGRSGSGSPGWPPGSPIAQRSENTSGSVLDRAHLF